MNLPERSSSKIKMTIHLPNTLSTNTEMGAAFDTYKSLFKFMYSEMYAMFKMLYVFGSLGCTIRREYDALQCPVRTAINNCATDFARF